VLSDVKTAAINHRGRSVSYTASHVQ